MIPMFTNKDLQHRSIFVINGLEHRRLKIVNFNLALEDTQTEKIITKIPFQKVLCLFIVGHTTITSPLIMRCNRHGIPVVVMNSRLRPVFFYSTTAEANYLLRQRQYEMPKEDLRIASGLVKNKIANQGALLKNLRSKSDALKKDLKKWDHFLDTVDFTDDLYQLMALEGMVAKLFFKYYFKKNDWKKRVPRVKPDPINAVMDIGYTILFNYIECMTRLFGFDPYRGVYHQLWFKRKSLICDLIEPFRCIIDIQIRKSFNYGTFSVEHFEVKNGAYFLKRACQKDYVNVFFKAIMAYKNPIFVYIRDYYRYFMRQKTATDFPQFDIQT